MKQMLRPLLAAVSLLAVAPAASDAPPSACFATYDINVCFSPWRVTRAEPGLAGVVMRKGPSFGADPIYRPDNTPVVIPIDGHFGRLSNRDGGVSNGCPNPGPRINQNGFLYGYYVGYAKQGWIPWNVDGTIYAVGDSAWTGTLCGPAKFDFDCRYPSSACELYHGCGGSPVPSATTCYEPEYHRVIPVGSTPGDLSQEKYYLRYGIDSTTYMWTVPGDTVVRHCNVKSGAYNWSCVTVVCAKYAPNGCRGWIRSDALGPVIDASEAPPCYPDLLCPMDSGSYQPDPGSLKRVPDGSAAVIETCAVTIAASDYFYVESIDRSAGIRVQRASHGVQPGDLVSVKGSMKTLATSERAVEAATVEQAGSAAVTALGIMIAQLGGQDWMRGPGPTQGQAGVGGGVGLNNVGMLVRCWGRITSTGANSFTLDDGSPLPLKGYVVNGTGVPAVTWGSAEGVSSLTTDGGVARPMLLVGTSSDISPL